jgi:hypothetical protein
MRKYHHLGIPTDVPREGETYLEKFEMYVSGYEESPYGIEWMASVSRWGLFLRSGVEAFALGAQSEPEKPPEGSIPVNIIDGTRSNDSRRLVPCA